MSEYLKWYSSHDAWSQMKEQAKIEIEDLTEKLANTNRRIAELENEVETLVAQNDFIREFALDDYRVNPTWLDEQLNQLRKEQENV